ncbi:hypothetical protein BC828DRAFT_373847 [Blastocladiella britannica]|nr:hypothetical protein BC828DRAFT_373847 [Blastocladiella britannica]
MNESTRFSARPPLAAIAEEDGANHDHHDARPSSSSSRILCAHDVLPEDVSTTTTSTFDPDPHGRKRSVTLDLEDIVASYYPVAATAVDPDEDGYQEVADRVDEDHDHGLENVILTSVPDPRDAHMRQMLEQSLAMASGSDPEAFSEHLDAVRVIAALRDCAVADGAGDDFEALLTAKRAEIPDAEWVPRVIEAAAADAPCLAEAFLDLIGWAGPGVGTGATSALDHLDLNSDEDADESHHQPPPGLATGWFAAPPDPPSTFVHQPVAMAVAAASPVANPPPSRSRPTPTPQSLLLPTSASTVSFDDFVLPPLRSPCVSRTSSPAAPGPPATRATGMASPDIIVDQDAAYVEHKQDEVDEEEIDADAAIAFRASRLIESYQHMYSTDAHPHSALAVAAAPGGGGGRGGGDSDAVDEAARWHWPHFSSPHVVVPVIFHKQQDPNQVGGGTGGRRPWYGSSLAEERAGRGGPL